MFSRVPFLPSYLLSRFSIAWHWQRIVSKACCRRIFAMRRIDSIVWIWMDSHLVRLLFGFACMFVCTSVRLYACYWWVYVRFVCACVSRCTCRDTTDANTLTRFLLLTHLFFIWRFFVRRWMPTSNRWRYSSCGQVLLLLCTTIPRRHDSILSLCHHHHESASFKWQWLERNHSRAGGWI